MKRGFCLIAGIAVLLILLATPLMGCGEVGEVSQEEEEFIAEEPALPEQPLEQVPVGAPSAVVYVDVDNVKGPWDGNSWATAYQTVQEGLDDASARGEEVWVAEGTYKPTSTTDRGISFQLYPGVALYGGFSGTETARSQRDWATNVTILSGDIGTAGDNSDNSYHVVIGADDATIDGFTVTGGNGLPAGGPGAGPPPGGPPPGGPPPGGPPPGGPPPGGPPPGAGKKPKTHISPDIILGGPSSRHGAGMLNYQVAPVVNNCIFKDNHAGKGGGMYNMCTKSFSKGQLLSAEGGDEPVPIITNCTFIGNYARGRGGGVANDLGTNPIFINCAFIDNSCGAKGGGMYNDFGCSPTVTNCLFVGNSAVTAGAMGNDGASSPTITNCTFTKNQASDHGAALYQGSGPANSPIVTNCILWGNICPSGVKEIFTWHECNPTVTYSCVEGGYRGVGNVDADPMFVDPENGDYRLAPGSPCIDYGNGSIALETDKDGNPRYEDKGRANGSEAALNGLPVDMGAYEQQADTEISAPATSPNPAPPPTPTPVSTPAPAPGSVPASDVVYVAANNDAGPWDGKAWATAYRTLQEGTDYACAAGAEVWVAKGTYKPTDTTDRGISFQLYPGVALYGGFSGTETARRQRDWATNVTILSGDIGTPGDNSDNSYHVVVGADDATIDGFTITGGNANGELSFGKGGGMINYDYSQARRGPFGPAVGYSPTVVNCTFSGNSASEGGAMYNYDRCTPILTNCTFIENSADYGGAIYDNVGTETKLTNCTFTKNYAKWRGGAMVMDYGSRPTVTGCSFIENSTDGNGGGIYTITRASQLEATRPVITNCTFDGNTAKFRGGGIGNYDQCQLTVTDCTFTGNYAGMGGGGISNDFRIAITLTNCTFSGNSAGEGEADIDTDASSHVELSER